MQLVDDGVADVAENQMIEELSERLGGVAQRIPTLVHIMKLIPVTTCPAGQKTLFVPPPRAVEFDAVL